MEDKGIAFIAVAIAATIIHIIKYNINTYRKSIAIHFLFYSAITTYRSSQLFHFFDDNQKEVKSKMRKQMKRQVKTIRIKSLD
mmetsp:Transcript_1888/g.1961  ORF Transcript_1888/g.1961 Transcript_1888/m.1961 type:complete len:83 (-) Transcript_1888:63-311(-)